MASDKYMNLQLLNAEEWENGQCKGVLGEILIRCNNVLYVRECPEEEEGQMQGQGQTIGGGQNGELLTQGGGDQQPMEMNLEK